MATTRKKASPKPRVTKSADPDDRELLTNAARALSRFDVAGRPVTLTLNGKLKVIVPGAVVKAIERACRAELDDEMTTQEAADFLNVSRPYLIRLLDEGKIPYRLVGAHRRINRHVVNAFDADMSRRRKEGLAKLAEEGQLLGLHL